VGTTISLIGRTPRRWQAVTCAMLIAAAILSLRGWLEADMGRHMLIEFPLLLIAGVCVALILADRTIALIMRNNQLGLAGFIFVSLIAAYWMIPAALDQSLLNGPAAAVKYASFLVAGMLLPASFRAAPLAMQAFFVGNWAWMTATVGLLYQSTPQQLCVNYRIGTQLSAGEGLVATAVVIVALWCVYAVPMYLKMTREADCAGSLQDPVLRSHQLG
jgi:hypothetical protein